MDRMNLFDGSNKVEVSNLWKDFKFTLLEVSNKGLYLDKIVRVEVNGEVFNMVISTSDCYGSISVDLSELTEPCIDTILSDLAKEEIDPPYTKELIGFNLKLMADREPTRKRYVRDKRLTQRDFIDDYVKVDFLDNLTVALENEQELLAMDTPEMGKLIVKFKTRYSDGEILEGKVSSVHKELCVIDYFNRNQYVTIANLKDGKVYDVLDYDEVDLDKYDLDNTVFYNYFGIHGNTEFYDLLINKPGKYRFYDDCVNSSFDEEIRNLYTVDEIITVVNKGIEAYKRRCKRFKSCPDGDIEDFTKYYKEALKRIYG